MTHMTKRPAPMPKLSLWSRDHVPEHKTRSEVQDATCNLEVQDYDGTGTNPNAWLTVRLAEEYHPATDGKPRRRISRTISMTLDAAQRRKLIDLLTRNPAQ